MPSWRLPLPAAGSATSSAATTCGSCTCTGRGRSNPAHARPGDATAFADAYPVTLASTASLGRLDDWVGETARDDRGEEPMGALAVERFRPNLVVDGDLDPFEEDRWQRVQVGAVVLRVVKPVDRCVMTTLDPTTLEGGHEPIRTLARHRRWDGATWFAVQLVPESRGVPLGQGRGRAQAVA